MQGVLQGQAVVVVSCFGWSSTSASVCYGSPILLWPERVKPGSLLLPCATFKILSLLTSIKKINIALLTEFLPSFICESSGN